MTSLLTTDPAVLVLEDGSRHTGRAYGGHASASVFAAWQTAETKPLIAADSACERSAARRGTMRSRRSQSSRWVAASVSAKRSK